MTAPVGLGPVRPVAAPAAAARRAEGAGFDDLVAGLLADEPAPEVPAPVGGEQPAEQVADEPVGLPAAWTPAPALRDAAPVCPEQTPEQLPADAAAVTAAAQTAPEAAAAAAVPTPAVRGDVGPGLPTAASTPSLSPTAPAAATEQGPPAARVAVPAGTEAPEPSAPPAGGAPGATTQLAAASAVPGSSTSARVASSVTALAGQPADGSPTGDTPERAVPAAGSQPAGAGATPGVGAAVPVHIEAAAAPAPPAAAAAATSPAPSSTSDPDLPAALPAPPAESGRATVVADVEPAAFLGAAPAAAPATPAATTPNAPTAPLAHTPALQPQLVRALPAVLRLGDGTHSVDLELHPAELGAVQLRVELSGRHVSLSVTSADPAVRELLRDALPELRRELERGGLATGSFDVPDRRTRDEPSRPAPRGRAIAVAVPMGAAPAAALRHDPTRALDVRV